MYLDLILSSHTFCKNEIDFETVVEYKSEATMFFWKYDITKELS